MKKIQSKAEYQLVMNQIEVLLKKATENGGFEALTANENKILAAYSRSAEAYEDSIPVIPLYH